MEERRSSRVENSLHFAAGFLSSPKEKMDNCVFLFYWISYVKTISVFLFGVDSNYGNSILACSLCFRLNCKQIKSALSFL